MPLQIIREDITKMKVDAIVNAANPRLSGGGGVDGMIHAAAGPQLLEACRALGGCKVGEAKVTPGFRLPAKYVIHTVGPVWQGGDAGEAEQLAACYRSTLTLAQGAGFASVAFPLISSGAYGYPKAEALRVAVETIAAFLLTAEDMTVYLVVFSREAYEVSGKLFSDVKSLIDDAYAREHEDRRNRRSALRESVLADEAAGFKAAPAAAMPREAALPDMAPAVPPPMASAPKAAGHAPRPQKKQNLFATGQLPNWDELVRRTDEGFSGMLLRKIDESGMTDAACYKKANIDRRVFSKIRSNPDYKPSKPTACAFALALELSPKEAEELLTKAGFALSPSQPFDIILRYCFEHGVYNVFEVNEVLFHYDQPLLGG